MSRQSNVRKPTDPVIECALMMLVVEADAQAEAAVRVRDAVRELAAYRGVIRRPGAP